MKQPLQALLIAGREAQAMCELGMKIISIREGTRGYSADVDMMLCCHLTNWARLVEVTSVRHCKLVEVTDDEVTDDGYSSISHALEDLRRFYPNLTFDSPVTVIRWRMKPC